MGILFAILIFLADHIILIFIQDFLHLSIIKITPLCQTSFSTLRAHELSFGVLPCSHIIKIGDVVRVLHTNDVIIQG